MDDCDQGASDILIVGGGPGGLATALQLAQYFFSVVVFDSLSFDKHIINAHAVPTWDRRRLTDLCKAVRKEIASKYSTVSFEQRTITAITKLDNLTFEACDVENRRWRGKAVVLATGVRYLFPDVIGYDSCWHHGLCHAITWGGHTTHGPRVLAGVLAIGEDMTAEQAFAEARLARRFVSQVTIYTNGSLELANLTKAILIEADIGGISVDSRPIQGISRTSKQSVRLEFSDGSSTHQSFLAHDPKTEFNGPFARQLGLELTEHGSVRIDDFETSVKGVFAVGDCASTSKTIPNAMGDGMSAAIRIMTQSLP